MEKQLETWSSEGRIKPVAGPITFPTYYRLQDSIALLVRELDSLEALVQKYDLLEIPESVKIAKARAIAVSADLSDYQAEWS